MASTGFRAFDLSSYNKFDAGDYLCIPLKPLLDISRVMCWVLLILCHYLAFLNALIPAKFDAFPNSYSILIS